MAPTARDGWHHDGWRRRPYIADGNASLVASAAVTTGARSIDGAATRTAGGGHARLLGFTLVILSACGYGSGPLFAKPVYAAGLDWLTLLAWRFLFGVVLSWAWVLAWPANRAALRRISPRRTAALLALGALFVGNSAAHFASLETVPASLAALILYIYPALVAVISIRFGRRLEGRRAWVALAIATLGVSLSLGGIDPTNAPPVHGLVLIIASPVIYSIWIVLAARVGGERPGRPEHPAQEPPIEPHDAPPVLEIEARSAAGAREVGGQHAAEETEPAIAAAILMTSTAVLYWVAAMITGRPTDPARIPAQAWPALLGLGIFTTAIAIQAFYAGARRIGAAQAALVSTVEPIYTIALATLLFAERLTAIQALGGVLVIAAVVLAQTGREQQGGRLRAAADPA